MKFGTKYIRNFGYLNVLHEDEHIFMEIYRRILVLGIFPVRRFGVNLNTYFMLNSFFRKMCHCKKHVKEAHAALCLIHFV
jgi:hypothetical protein